MSSGTFDTGPNLGNGICRSIILDEARGIDAGKITGLDRRGLRSPLVARS
jgi:hypothetical protein